MELVKSFRTRKFCATLSKCVDSEVSHFVLTEVCISNDCQPLLGSCKIFELFAEADLAFLDSIKPFIPVIGLPFKPRD